MKNNNKHKLTCLFFANIPCSFNSNRFAGTAAKRDGVCNTVAYVLCKGAASNVAVGVANPDLLWGSTRPTRLGCRADTGM